MKLVRLSIKSLKYLLYTVFVLVALLLLLLFLALFTHHGNNLVFDSIEEFEPRLTIQLSEGTIANSPTYKLIRWHDGDTLIELESLKYQFDWHCLLKSVCLDSLSLQSAKVNISPAQDAPEPESSEPFRLDFPIPVSIKKLSLSNVSVNVAEVSIVLNQLNLSAHAQDNDINLQTNISGLTVQLPDSPTQASNAKNVAKQPSNHLTAILQNDTLPEVVLPFDLFVDQVTLEQFKLKQGKQQLLDVKQMHSQVSLQGSNLIVDKFNLVIPEADLALTGHIDLSKRYPMHLDSQIKIKQVKQLEPTDMLSGQHIQISSRGDLANLKTDISLSKLVNAKINSTINLYQDDLPYQLSVNWQQLQWPLSGEAVVTAQQGKLKSSGKLSDYSASFYSQYQLADMPSGDINFKAKGNLNSVQLSQLLVNTLNGQIQANGRLDWQQGIDWQGQLKLSHVQLSEIDESLPSDVNGEIDQQFTITSDANNNSQWSFVIPRLEIDGKVLNYPFSLLGKLNGQQDKGINVEQLSLVNDNNQIHATGHLSEHNDLNITLDLQDLNKLVADAHGKVNGKVQVTGRLQESNINAQINAQDISYQKNDIDNISLNSEVTLSELPLVKLNLDVNKLTTNHQLIDKVQVKISPEQVSNNQKQHQIDLNLESEVVTTHLQAFFLQQPGQWKTGLKQGAIKTIQGIWELDKPFDATLKDEHLNISEHCWRATNDNKDENGQICMHKVYIGDNGDIDISIHDFMLTTLSPFVPNTLTMHGALDATFKAFWKSKNKPNIDFLLDGKEVVFDIKLDENQKQFSSYAIEQFNASLNSKGNDAKFAINLFSQGLIDTKLKGEIKPYLKQPFIDADLELSLPDFGAFTGLLNGVDKLQGQLQSNIAITGDLKQPNVKGKLYIVDTKLKATGLPVQVYDLNSSIDFDQYSAKVDGYFFTNEITKSKVNHDNHLTKGFKLLKRTAVNTVNIPQRIAQNALEKEKAPSKGRADIKGYFDWKNKLKGDLHFKAEQMLIQDYGKIKLFVSPDLHLLFADIISLKGAVKVDKGNITIKELPEGAVTVSKDVIVVDAAVKKDASDVPIEMDIKVDLGDSLRIKAVGLDTYINGVLKVYKERLKELTVNGELSFSEGSYRAFAQQLVLQDSRIIFRGAPDEPYLSIEAIRDPRTVEDGVTAGVRVTGTPEQLKLTVFSDPSMSQQNALSYIISGRSLENSGDDSQITSILIDLSASKTDGVMSKIGSKIGIDDLSLSASGQGDEQSVGVKGTIAPGVELSYGVGVFDSFTILAIRYELFKRFYIEASSGLYQAVDAYYEWDWD